MPEVRRARPLLSVVIVAGLALTALMVTSCLKGYSGPIESVVVGMQKQEWALPLAVAHEKRLFARNGVDVTLKIYDTGSGAMNDLVKGSEASIVLCSEYILARNAGQKIQAIASIDMVDYTFLVGRKDRGIHAIADLKGKRIAVVRGTALEFSLGRFLELHGLRPRDVVVVNGSTFSQCGDMAVAGDVDAFISVDPFLSSAVSRLGDNAVSWGTQGSQLFYGLLVCRSDWIAGHGSAVERFLRAMSQAEDLILRHPEEAKVVAKKRLDFTDEAVARFWPRNAYSLSLDRSLIAALEDETRWMIDNHLITDTVVPDFMNLLSRRGLSAVKPEAVNLFR
jgi:NitT/TauT family transport system substrate-binding protein